MRAPKLTLVVAVAGYGKTTTLRRLFPGPAVAWHRGVDPGTLGATDPVGELLDAEFGLSSPDLAERVVAVTAGWPKPSDIPNPPGRSACSPAPGC